MVVEVFAALGLATTLYAVFLNYRPVNEWYTPDWTWLTVVGGNGLILGAIMAFALLGEIPIRAFWLAFGCNVVAGIPIIGWQLIAAARRRQNRTARQRRL